MKTQQGVELRRYSVPTMAEIKALPWNGLTAVSLFAGCGGSSLGYRMAGYRVGWANEVDPAARASYAANSDTIIDPRDIREVKPEDVLAALGMKRNTIDLLDASPPCTPWTTNGIREQGWSVKRKHSGITQRVDDLFDEYVRLLHGLKPRTFVVENVVGLTLGIAAGYFNDLMLNLRHAGYRVSACKMSSDKLGVPQARHRVIIHGVRGDLIGGMPTFPSPLKNKPFTAREAWRGLPPLTDAERDDLWLKEGTQGRRMWDRTVPGDTFVKASQRLKGTDSFFGWRRLAYAKPSPTILSATPLYFHPEEPRLLSIAEVKRLCSFPDDFILVGTHAEQWKRLGNCVPPFMARAMGAHIRDHVLAS